MIGGGQMQIPWGTFWRKSRKWLKTGWLIMAGIAAIYYGAIQPSQAFRGIAMERASALAAFEERRHEHWFQPNSPAAREEPPVEGVVGGVPGGGVAFQKGVVTRSEDDDKRKIV